MKLKSLQACVESVEWEIEGIMDDPEYKKLSHIVQGCPYHDCYDYIMKEWNEIQGRLNELSTQKDYFLKNIEALTTKNLKGVEISAQQVVHYMQTLSMTARQLHRKYQMEPLGNQDEFDDVLHAVGFYCRRDVAQYFATKKNPKRNYKCQDGTNSLLEDEFTREEWISLIKLNSDVSMVLHALPMTDAQSKFTSVHSVEQNAEFVALVATMHKMQVSDGNARLKSIPKSQMNGNAGIKRIGF